VDCKSVNISRCFINTALFFCRPITRAIEKTSSTPQIRQPQVRSKLDTNSTSSAPTIKGPASLSNQPRRGGVVGDIAKQAAAVAIVAIILHY